MYNLVSTYIHEFIFSFPLSWISASPKPPISTTPPALCQSYHCALGSHFSRALMGAVMARWLTGWADFLTLIMTSPHSRFRLTSHRITSHHIKAGWLEGEKDQKTFSSISYWENNEHCQYHLQQKWSASTCITVALTMKVKNERQLQISSIGYKVTQVKWGWNMLTA